MLDLKAKKSFEFHAAYYPPIYAGRKAYTIEELIDGIRKVDGFSLFYHVFHPVFSSHVVPYDLHNDFAFWLRNELHDDSLAYKVSDVEGAEPKTVEQVRDEILKILESSTNKTRAQKPFHFITCRPVVFDTGKKANSIGEFIDIISNITMRSVVYHFVFRRAMGYSQRNDFSAWLDEEFHVSNLADKLSKIDPQTYVDEETLRQDILLIVNKVIYQ
ncbi:hypothetical protein DFR87_06285 [Metallosphaera hakonensis JCM 8857 = DSM 7519]|uniref:Uncharacterized protein n=1 Tax=Metallosphaera hakonensis JCM 8857 = DSM 7519 TaxID=1293036 RepID=A0A2U9IX73_9CREN|nr:hypothetical protein DFR87_06285 [Metallosphaera hakonensis JCM 8857 = DSM 7519]